MKRRDLIKTLEKSGYRFERHGSNHDVYVKERITVAVPRHKEIKEQTAKAILKEAGI